MRTKEEIEVLLQGGGFVSLSEEESTMFKTNAKHSADEPAIVLSFTNTHRDGDKTVTRTASLAFPCDRIGEGLNSFSQAALEMLKQFTL
jgi:histone acetyltransferase (RNA polymerase elongator complex component)